MWLSFYLLDFFSLGLFVFNSSIWIKGRMIFLNPVSLTFTDRTPLVFEIDVVTKCSIISSGISNSPLEVSNFFKFFGK